MIITIKKPGYYLRALCKFVALPESEDPTGPRPPNPSGQGSSPPQGGSAIDFYTPLSGNESDEYALYTDVAYADHAEHTDVAHADSFIAHADHDNCCIPEPVCEKCADYGYYYTKFVGNTPVASSITACACGIKPPAWVAKTERADP